MGYRRRSEERGLTYNAEDGGWKLWENVERNQQEKCRKCKSELYVECGTGQDIIKYCKKCNKKKKQ